MTERKIPWRMNYKALRPLEELLNKTLTEIIVPDHKGQVVFVCASGEEYLMMHDQDCCESVGIEEIIGDLDDLLNSPVLRAESTSNHDNPPEHADSFTWTFYKLATIKGEVVLRWLGESNGYYSEEVDFYLLNGE